MSAWLQWNFNVLTVNKQKIPPDIIEQQLASLYTLKGKTALQCTIIII